MLPPMSVVNVDLDEIDLYDPKGYEATAPYETFARLRR